MSEPSYEPLDRRPIKARSTRWAATAADALVRAGVSPNAISMAGLFAAVAGGVALAFTGAVETGGAERLLWLLGIALVQSRLLCNMLDGMVAVASERASPIGELYNEVPDRVADVGVLVGLGYAAGGNATLGYVAACMALFVAYVRAMAKAAGAPNDFRGPMAKPHRMFVVTAIGIYMVVAPGAWQIAWGPGSAWGIAAAGLLIIIAGGAVTAMRRLQSAARSLLTNM
ncbi:CDP-alcohol phosphatidyltransferase family protein [Salinisphaera sp.]|uniref:CDP-alcohol phosphatidyltransferase family protein n=1 Tax=Salinisphaera sp. TaxID=1914330 RepID=UPI002D78F62E|nr:CDP-alcohol phosphatidyltransferase family protein [Salinisphaera sp.]HET7315257.1 CDP-alcohol phosphatidyltransferase family protein [Salinisphaera sp.]